MPGLSECGWVVLPGRAHPGGHHAGSETELTNACLIPPLQIEVRPMMYVALTYDHRLIDGREAVTFLRKIKAAVEDPRVLLLDL